MNSPTCPSCAELEAKLARVQAKSARRHKALRELNKAMRITNLMVVTQIGRNRALNEKFGEKPGILKRLWRYFW